MPHPLDHLTDLFKKTDDIYHACISGRAGIGDLGVEEGVNPLVETVWMIAGVG